MRRTLVVVLALVLALAAAFGVDEVAYYRWRVRMARIAAQFERSNPSGPDSVAKLLPPGKSPLSKPGIAFLLFYQPPALAWTYHVSLHSRFGYRVANGYLVMKRAVLPDGVPADFTTEHSPYVLGVRRCMPYDPCAPKGAWQPYVEHQVGSF